MDHGDAGVGIAVHRAVGDEPVLQGEIPGGMVRRVRHKDQVGERAVGEPPHGEAVLAEHVAIDQPEGLIPQQWQGTMDAAARFQRRVALLAVAHADANGLAVADVIAYLLARASRG